MIFISWLFIHQPAIISNIANLIGMAGLAAVGSVYRRLKCKTCWRWGLHKVARTVYRTCTKHTTLGEHACLLEKHADEHPQQHALLNQENDAAL